MNFHSMSRKEQTQAILRLATEGQGDHTIGAATGLSVEQIRHVLAISPAIDLEVYDL